MGMDIWRKSTSCLVIRVRNIVSCNWFLASYHTNPGHVAASCQLTKYLPNVTILESSPQKRIKLKKELRFIPERPTDSKIIEDSRPERALAKPSNQTKKAPRADASLCKSAQSWALAHQQLEPTP